MTDSETRSGSHDYLSTSCLHEVHPLCPETCKYCDVPCRCACHGDPETVS